MWAVVLRGTAMRLSDLLLTTLLLDWPSLGEMKPQPRQAVDPRSETGASEQQLQYLCLVVRVSEMNASGGAAAVSQESPQDFPSKLNGLCQRWREDLWGHWLSRCSLESSLCVLWLSMKCSPVCFSSYLSHGFVFYPEIQVFLVPSLYCWKTPKSPPILVSMRFCPKCLRPLKHLYLDL